MDVKKIHAPIIVPHFLDRSGAGYKVISVYAKKARGAMARFLCSSSIQSSKDMLAFNELGYYYNPSKSSYNRPVFVREHPSIF